MIPIIRTIIFGDLHCGPPTSTLTKSEILSKPLDDEVVEVAPLLADLT